MKKGEPGSCFVLPRVVLVAGQLTSHSSCSHSKKQALKVNLYTLKLLFRKQWIYALSIPLTHTQLKPPSGAYKRRCISGMRVKPHPLIKLSF